MCLTPVATDRSHREWCDSDQGAQGQSCRRGWEAARKVIEGQAWGEGRGHVPPWVSFLHSPDTVCQRAKWLRLTPLGQAQAVLVGETQARSSWARGVGEEEGSEAPVEDGGAVRAMSGWLPVKVVGLSAMEAASLGPLLGPCPSPIVSLYKEDSSLSSHLLWTTGPCGVLPPAGQADGTAMPRAWRSVGNRKKVGRWTPGAVQDLLAQSLAQASAVLPFQTRADAGLRAGQAGRCKDCAGPDLPTPELRRCLGHHSKPAVSDLGFCHHEELTGRSTCP